MVDEFARILNEPAAWAGLYTLAGLFAAVVIVVLTSEGNDAKPPGERLTAGEYAMVACLSAALWPFLLAAGLLTLARIRLRRFCSRPAGKPPGNSTRN